MSALHKFRPAALRALAVASLVALTSACANRPEIRHDQAPDVDLGSYRTFAFYEPPAGAHLGYTALLSRHVRLAAREALERHHYVYTERDPDLRVHAVALVAERRDLHSTPGPGPWGGGIETVDEHQGTLVIDVVDARRRALVWRGVAEGKLDEDAMLNPGATVHSAVGQILADYPDSRA